MLFAFLHVIFVMSYIFRFQDVHICEYTNIFDHKFETKKFCVSCCCLENLLNVSSEQFGHMYCGFNIVRM